MDSKEWQVQLAQIQYSLNQTGAAAEWWWAKRQASCSGQVSGNATQPGSVPMNQARQVMAF